jgi:hypothetical protein
MELRFDLDPPILKVAVIGVLMFLESLLVPILAKLQGGNFPTQIEFCTYLIAAVLVLITYLLVFVKTGETGT